MTAINQERNALVKNAYPEATPEKCRKCGYFVGYLPGAKAEENGKYCGACACNKTGNGAGPLC